MTQFFKNPQFDFAIRGSLGDVYHRAADTGEVLATAARIRDGDAESWHREWYITAQRIQAIAEKSESAGHRVSARDAWLRAATYYHNATGTLDGTRDPDRLLPTWRLHRAAFHRFTQLTDPVFEAVRIPYEGTKLVGYLLRPRRLEGRVPLVILNNGSDGPISGMWANGGMAATERGWLALVFDGPGQGEALLEQGLPFRPDWEKVITPVMEFVLGLDEVDPDRVAITGLSQGGYWVPRAVAFEHRIAAAVADPGVVDVSSAWMANLPKPLQKMLEQGEREQFESTMEIGMRMMSAEKRQILAWRGKPYGKKSVYDTFRAAMEYRIDANTARKIRCPVLITDPDREQFWPGQAQALYDMLECPRTLMRFTEAEGADWHCEPMGRGLCDQRIFDWLEDVLKVKRS